MKTSGRSRAAAAAMGDPGAQQYLQLHAAAAATAAATAGGGARDEL